MLKLLRHLLFNLHFQSPQEKWSQYLHGTNIVASATIKEAYLVKSLYNGVVVLLASLYHTRERVREPFLEVGMR